MIITNKSKRNLLIIGAILTGTIVISAWAFISATPSAVSGATLDDQTLQTKALEWARVHGLQGDPLAMRAARITLGQWVTLTGGQLLPGATQLFGADQNVPVFALALRGNVTQRGFGGSIGGQKPLEQFDNIIIVVDARNGQLIAATTAHNPSEMLLQVPLNTLTPAPPINFVPTRPPITPPTLAAKATSTNTPMPSILATPTVPTLR